MIRQLQSIKNQRLSIKYLNKYETKKEFKNTILLILSSNVCFYDYHIYNSIDKFSDLNTELKIINFDFLPQFGDIFDFFKFPCYIFMYNGKKIHQEQDYSNLDRFKSKVFYFLNKKEKVGDIMVNTNLTEADKIWETVKDVKLEMFALPNQTLSMYCVKKEASPDKLFLEYKISSVIPAVEAVLSSKYNVEVQDKYLVLSNKKVSNF